MTALKEYGSLASRLRNKDESALEEVIRKFMPLVSTIIYNVGRGSLCKEDIEEVCADTFITLWKNSGKVRDESLKGYICCIAKTKTFDKLASAGNKNTSDIDEIDPADDFSLSGFVEQKEINRVLGDIVDSLGQPDSEIVMRYYYYYQRISEIAGAMGMTTDSVKVRLHRARAKIKKKLSERGFDNG